MAIPSKLQVRTRLLTALAVAGLVFAYVQVELHTVYGPHVLLGDWRLSKYWNYLLGMVASPGHVLKLRDWGPPPPWAQVVHWLRWPARLLVLLSFGTLFVAELKGSAVSNLVRGLTRTRRCTWLTLLALGVLSGFYFLLPGYVTAAVANGDYYTHLAWLVRDALEHGGFPIWTNWGAMGFPLMQFYSPLFFTITALANFLIPNIWIAVKVVFLLLHVASVAVMYFLVRQVTGSKNAALIAAFAYGFAYYRYHTIVFLNKFVLAPTFLIWPLQLYLVERLLAERGSRRAGVGLAVASAAGLAAHVNFGLHGVIFAAIYGMVRVLASGDRAPTFRSKAVATLRLAF